MSERNSWLYRPPGVTHMHGDELWVNVEIVRKGNGTQPLTGWWARPWFIGEVLECPHCQTRFRLLEAADIPVHRPIEVGGYRVALTNYPYMKDIPEVHETRCPRCYETFRFGKKRIGPPWARRWWNG